MMQALGKIKNNKLKLQHRPYLIIILSNFKSRTFNITFD